jgi:cell division protein FtsA
MLTDIIEPRTQELLSLIADDLRRAGLHSQIPAGLVLTGGGARLNGFAEFTEQGFHLPVRVAEPRGIQDLPEQVAQPEYATAVGLVLYAAKARRTAQQRPGNFVAKLKSMFVGA